MTPELLNVTSTQKPIEKTAKTTNTPQEIEESKFKDLYAKMMAKIRVSHIDTSMPDEEEDDTNTLATNLGKDPLEKTLSDMALSAAGVKDLNITKKEL